MSMIFNLERYLQPLPTETQVSHARIGGRTITSIARVWRTEDVMRCTLCPKGQCMASYTDETCRSCVCLVVAMREVGQDEAPLYRRHVPRPPRIDAAN